MWKLGGKAYSCVLPATVPRTMYPVATEEASSVQLRASHQWLCLFCRTGTQVAFLS